MPALQAEFPSLGVGRALNFHTPLNVIQSRAKQSQLLLAGQKILLSIIDVGVGQYDVWERGLAISTGIWTRRPSH